MIIRHKTFDTTVNTIDDRNNIQYKVDHMVVLVKDAISDMDAGPGEATYRYDATGLKWILISKSTTYTMSFGTEELMIIGGSVVPSNIPANNSIWDVLVLDGDNVIAYPRAEELAITPTSINNLTEYEGKKLRFTYAYGTFTQQMNSVLDERIGETTDFDEALV